MRMKPPYSLTPKMLHLCTKIAHDLGGFDGMHVTKPELALRKSNRVRTIQGSLAIEGNTLDLDQVTAILDGKRVLGTQKEILEVQNAIKTYDQIKLFNPRSSKSLREAHGLLMHDLLPDAGRWRNSNVGVFQGARVAHAAPQAKRVPELMENLFSFIKSEKETHALILSAIFHYELEFIHPFSDGNGRIGRLWQTTMLAKFHPIFEYCPIESIIRNKQKDYYNVLGLSDKLGDLNPFIEFSLATISEALESLSSVLRPAPMTSEDRLATAKDFFKRTHFSRKDYLALFKAISTATASRDLAQGVSLKLLKKQGDKRLAKYLFT